MSSLLYKQQALLGKYSKKDGLKGLDEAPWILPKDTRIIMYERQVLDNF